MNSTLYDTQDLQFLLKSESPPQGGVSLHIIAVPDDELSLDEIETMAWGFAAKRQGPPWWISARVGKEIVKHAGYVVENAIYRAAGLEVNGQEVPVGSWVAGVAWSEEVLRLFNKGADVEPVFKLEDEKDSSMSTDNIIKSCLEAKRRREMCEIRKRKEIETWGSPTWRSTPLLVLGLGDDPRPALPVKKALGAGVELYSADVWGSRIGDPITVPGLGKNDRLFKVVCRGIDITAHVAISGENQLMAHYDCPMDKLRVEWLKAF